MLITLIKSAVFQDICQKSMGPEYLTISMAAVIWGFWSVLVRLIKFVPLRSHVFDKCNIFRKHAYVGNILFTIISYHLLLRYFNQWIHIHFMKN